MGPTRSRRLSPSSVTVCASSVWLEIVMRTGPAPNELRRHGDLVLLDDPGELQRCGGARVVLEVVVAAAGQCHDAQSPGDQARSSSTRIVLIAADPIPRGGTLTEPDGRTPPQHLRASSRLNAASHLIGERLDERWVLRVVGAEVGHVDRLEEADLELRRQVHERRGEAEVRKGVADGEVDRPVSCLSSGTWAKIGIASSAPTTATGTIGTCARMAVRTKPPRPKRRSL